MTWAKNSDIDRRALGAIARRAGFVLTGLALWVPLLHGQQVVFVPWSAEGIIGHAVGKSLGDAATAMVAGRIHRARWSAEIERARQDFWRNYPDGPGRQEAEARFAAALLEKDIYFLALESLNRAAEQVKPDLRGSRVGFGDALAWMVAGEKPDGGVTRFAEREFKDWVRATLSGDPQKTLAQALEETENAYRSYRIVRDLGEFLFSNPRSPLRVGNDAEYLTAWYVARKFERTFERARERVGELQRYFPAAVFGKVVAELKSEDSLERIRDRGAGKEHYEQLVEWRLARYSPRMLALHLIKRRTNGTWSEAEKQVEARIALHGKAAVERAMEKAYTTLDQPNGCGGPPTVRLRMKPGWVDCVAKELGEAAGSGGEVYRRALATLDREATRRKLLAQDTPGGADTEMARERWAELANSLDETILLAAAHYEYSTGEGQGLLGGFRPGGGQELADEAVLQLLQGFAHDRSPKDFAVVALSVPVRATLLERLLRGVKGYRALVSKYGEAKLAEATAAIHKGAYRPRADLQAYGGWAYRDGSSTFSTMEIHEALPLLLRQPPKTAAEVEGLRARFAKVSGDVSCTQERAGVARGTVCAGGDAEIYFTECAQRSNVLLYLKNKDPEYVVWTNEEYKARFELVVAPLVRKYCPSASQWNVSNYLDQSATVDRVVQLNVMTIHTKGDGLEYRSVLGHRSLREQREAKQ